MRKLLLGTCFGVAALFTAGYAVANDELTKLSAHPESVGDAHRELRQPAILGAQANQHR